MSYIYIFGGGYLVNKLYRAIIPYVNVLSVVDKKGKLMIEMEDIPIMDMVNFRSHYENQMIIVTPLIYYQEIYRELKAFVAEDKIVFLEEFGGR